MYKGWRRTVVVGEVEQHSNHSPHAVFHRFTHVTVVAVGQRSSRQGHRAVVQRPAVALDHVLTVSQSSGQQMRAIRFTFTNKNNT